MPMADIKYPLTPEERQKVIETVKEKRFSSIPPHEIVPYWLF